jgi:hypothetical protein
MTFFSRWRRRRACDKEGSEHCAVVVAELEEAKREEQEQIRLREEEQRRKLHALRNAAQTYLIRANKET